MAVIDLEGESRSESFKDEDSFLISPQVPHLDSVQSVLKIKLNLFQTLHFRISYPALRLFTCLLHFRVFYFLQVEGNVHEQ